MDSTHTGLFGEAMHNLRLCYTTHVGNDAEWTARKARYYRGLQDHEWETVRKAMTVAPNPDRFPNRFPTVGQLAIICKDLERSKAVEDKARDTEAWRHRQDEETREEISALREVVIPNDPAKQKSWVLAAKTPWEGLARYWEAESKYLRIDPCGKTPEELHKRRLAQFWELWNREHEGMKVPVGDSHGRQEDHDRASS